MEASFLELRCKEVINVVDGTRLGRIVDIVFDLPSGQILGIVVPGNKTIFSFLKGANDLYIPFSQICKIGADAILVELFGVNNPVSTYSTQKDKNYVEKNVINLKKWYWQHIFSALKYLQEVRYVL